MMTAERLVCWSCRGLTVSGLFCQTCDAILPMVAGEDFFHLFAIEPAFEVDLVTLEQHYRNLQKRLHPDFFAHRGPLERRLSLEHITRVNEAWQILTDSLSRADYLLRLVGWQSNKTTTDPEFLYTVMELRESLEEVNPQAADAMQRLEGLRTEALGRMQTEERQIAALFRDFFAQNNPELLAQIARLVDRIRYHRRYLEELDRLEEQAFA